MVKNNEIWLMNIEKPMKVYVFLQKILKYVNTCIINSGVKSEISKIFMENNQFVITFDVKSISSNDIHGKIFKFIINIKEIRIFLEI